MADLPTFSWGWNTTTTTASVEQNRMWNQWHATAGTGSITVPVTFTATANSTIQNVVWDDWNRTYRLTLTTAPPAAPSQADLGRMQREREAASQRRLAAQRQLAHAQDRALDLLAGILTDEETRYRMEHAEIMVRGSDGGMYVIEERSVHGNIRHVDEHGCVLGRLCVAPDMYDRDANAALPLADGWIGQYLAIKFNEADLRAKANWSGRRDCQQGHVALPMAA